MQFIITAYDGKDENALSRRMAARASHLENIKKINGKVKCAGGIKNDQDLPIGSFLILEFENKDLFDEYLATEPYVVNKVWQDIKVESCSVVIMNDEMVGK